MRRRGERSLLLIKSLDDADAWAVGQLLSGSAYLRCRPDTVDSQIPATASLWQELAAGPMHHLHPHSVACGNLLLRFQRGGAVGRACGPLDGQPGAACRLGDKHRRSQR
jgi:hypothetical protein